MHKYSTLMSVAKKCGCDILENEPMANHTTFKTGGGADLFLCVKSEDALVKILAAAKDAAVPIFILGKGSNLLVSDAGIRGCVIKLAGDFAKISLLDEDTIECGAGVSLAKLCSFALKNNLSGLEFAWGIPGSAGGAAFMNAGAYGGEMKDVLVCCKHVDLNGNLGSRCDDELELSYRRSFYSRGDAVITSLTLSLKEDSHENIKARMDDFMQRRMLKQPLEFPSAGSTFKRPDGYFAGSLIEKCGLKGTSVGGAQVSEKHAGFIVNSGGATTADILGLISLIQKRVLEEHGVSLECEVRTVGEF